jgi:hypothetical protein
MTVDGANAVTKPRALAFNWINVAEISVGLASR